jgi:hypothetical protein
MTRAEEFAPQEIANVAWCLAKAEIRNGAGESKPWLDDSLRLRAAGVLQHQVVRQAAGFEVM